MATVFCHEIDHLSGILFIDKAVEFTAFLIVEEPFLFTNSDLSKEWSGESYYVEKYNEIGASLKVTIPIEHKKEGKKSSIFQFQELPTLDPLSPAYYNIDGDVIYFIVPRPLFKMYNKVQSRKHEVILASFIIPALTDILRQMINPSEEELNDAPSVNSFEMKTAADGIVLGILAKQENYSKIEKYILSKSKVANFQNFL